MKTFLVSIFLIAICAISCNKNDLSHGPIVKNDDTTLSIVRLSTVDINEFEIGVQVKPYGLPYSRVFLQWSLNEDFKTKTDSLLLIDNISTSGNFTHKLTGLLQAEKYFFRIRAKHKETQLFSVVRTMTTDTLKIQGFARTEMPLFNRTDTAIMITNFAYSPTQPVPASKIWLGDYPCPLVQDDGGWIYFSIPATIIAGKYPLKLVRKGLTTVAKDSVEVPEGRWNILQGPSLNVSPQATQKGLTNFGTAFNDQKGWLIGGYLFPSVSYEPASTDLYEFDLQQERWTRKALANKRFFFNAHCYYYNNSIYVIAGLEHIKTMLNSYNIENLGRVNRLDLASLTWHTMDTLPFASIYNQTSFALNNEWYVGMGRDKDSLDICCQIPLPSNRFFKYSPKNNQWAEIARFPGGLQLNPTSFSLGSKGYVFCGAIPDGDVLTSVNFTQEFWEYDPMSNSWSRIFLPEDVPIPYGEKYQIQTIGGKIYFFTSQVNTVGVGGYSYQFRNPCIEYDPEKRTFRRFAFLKEPAILKYIGKYGDKYFFHGSEMGYTADIPDETYSFQLKY